MLRESSITWDLKPNPARAPVRSSFRAHAYGNAIISRQRGWIDLVLTHNYVPRHGTSAYACVQLELILKALQLNRVSATAREGRHGFHRGRYLTDPATQHYLSAGPQQTRHDHYRSSSRSTPIVGVVEHSKLVAALLTETGDEEFQGYKSRASTNISEHHVLACSSS